MRGTPAVASAFAGDEHGLEAVRPPLIAPAVHRPVDLLESLVGRPVGQRAAW